MVGWGGVEWVKERMCWKRRLREGNCWAHDLHE